MKELMISLLIWISGETGLHYDGVSVPDLELASKHTITLQQFGGELPDDFNPKLNKIKGLFDHAQNRVYLLEKLDMDNLYHRSFLLHELVHYLQYANHQDAEVECRQQLEPLAYEVQKRYLRDRQYWAPFSKNKIFILSQCRSDFRDKTIAD